MRMHAFVGMLAALTFLATAPASAEQNPDDDTITLGAGARVGGYGFREVTEEGTLTWDDCRMDGVGLFGTADFGKYLFAELSLDYYHAIGEVIASGMDRQSATVLGAAGLRLYPDFIISPYIQAGVGPEWTKISMEAATETKLLAAAFVGVGGELDMWGLKLGSNIRVFAMGEPVHGPGPGGHHHQPTVALDGSRAIETEYEVAGQAQFFVRREF
jgi:hypothetical protein